MDKKVTRPIANIRLVVGIAWKLVSAAATMAQATQAESAERPVLDLVGQTNRAEVSAHELCTVPVMVRDASRRPLAGVELVLWPGWRAISKEVITDANGKCVLTWNPQHQDIPGNELFVIARDQKRNLALAQTIDEQTANLDLRLAPGITLTARAMDAKGNPIPKAEVALTFYGERVADPMGRPMLTDAHGRFEITALPAGHRYGITISSEGCPPLSRTVPKEATGRRIDLGSLPMPFADEQIAGVILDAEGRPVADAKVLAYGPGQPSLSSHSDSQGRFSFSHVYAGFVLLWAKGPDSEASTDAARAGNTNIVFRLQIRHATSRNFDISGRVIDPEGRPAAGALVSVFPSVSEDREETDNEGRFNVTFNSSLYAPFIVDLWPVLVARDPPRNLAVALELRGFPPMPVAQAKAAEPKLCLQPGFAVVGRVTDPNGGAITNAQVQVCFHTEPGDLRSKIGSPARADVAGRFGICGLPAGGQYSVKIFATGYGQEWFDLAASDTQTNRVELEPCQLLPANRRIAGVAFDDSFRPAAYASIESYGNRQPYSCGLIDANGHFSLDGVCEAPIEVRLFALDGRVGHIVAEGGDTNIVIRTSLPEGMPAK